MADTSLVFNIVAKDKASSAMEKIRGKSVILGAAIGALAVKFGKDSVSAFVEAQTAQDQLSAAFAKFPALANTNIGRLQSLNSALALKTKFDDDATASGQAVLANFKLTGKQIEQLTPLLQDYAARTGKDLPTAATDLGKAMLGQGRALKAVGIEFTDTGNAAGNFSELQGALNAKVGGFAEREGKTAAGQAAILKNQFGELEESVGSKLVPVLTALAGKLLEIIGFVQRNSSVIVPLVGTLTGLVATVWAVNAASKAWTSTTTAFNTVMGLFTSKATEAGGAAKGMGGILSSGGIWGIAVAAGVAILGAFIIKHQEAKARVEALTTSLDQSTGAITRETRATVTNNLEKSGALAAAQKLGISLKDVTAAALGNQAATDRVTAALNDYRRTLPDATGKTAARTGANVQLSASEREVAGNVARVSGAISDNSAEMEAARAKAARLREAMNAIPNTTATVTIRGGQAAINELAQVRFQTEQIPRSVTVQVLTKAQRIPQRAAGGPVNAGSTYLVGEQGPELITGVSGMVHSASRTQQMMASPSGRGGGIGGITVNINGALDPKGAATAVKAALEEWVRTNGPLPARLTA